MLKQLLLAFCFVCSAWGASLEWNASVVDEQHAAPTGYRLHRGPAPGAYDWQIDVGNVLQWPIPDDLYGEYYWSASAYNASGSSGYSNEVYFTRDAPPVYVGAVNLRASKLQQEPIMADTALYTSAIAVYDFENNANDTKGAKNLTPSGLSYSTTGEAQGTYWMGELAGSGVASRADADFRFTSSYSVSFWCQCQYMSFGVGPAIGTSDGTNGWNILVTNAGIRVQHLTTGTARTVTFSGYTFLDNVRYHIVVAYDDTADTVTAWVSRTTFGDCINGTSIAQTYNPTAGAETFEVNWDDYYGFYDEVVLWNSAITSTNAAAIFAARDGGTSWRETGGGASAVPVIMRSYRARRN